MYAYPNAVTSRPMFDAIRQRLGHGTIGIASGFPQEFEVASLDASQPASTPSAGLPDPTASNRAPYGAVTVPMPPPRPSYGFDEKANIPDTDAKPIIAAPQPGAAPPAMPLPAAPAPATAPSPVANGPAAGKEAGGSDFMKAWQALGESGIGDQGLALAAGLLSAPGTTGWARAFDLMGRAGTTKASTDLARTELALKQRKLAQETGALKGNAAIIKRAFPNLTDEEAAAQGSNSTAVSEALKILRDPNHGRENDPAVIRARAQAQAEGAAAGKPEKAKWRQVQTPDGGTMLYNEDDPTQNQMLVQGQPVRPATEEELQRFGIAPGQGVKMTAKDGPVAIGTPPRPQAQTFERPDGTKETRVLNSRTGQ
ncbi:hypothetical protein [Methylorubrum populi]|uniref:Uncharacterized protein n=1 Tax=Methylorubrum populi TaxID=223967 RepID=A0A833J121_9HYPH|nr:hypothetical protein [Methylorubrum populi]KAB7782169.1 hypothetical protein F8B43_4924 [Methylorubrum populi]